MTVLNIDMSDLRGRMVLCLLAIGFIPVGYVHAAATTGVHSPYFSSADSTLNIASAGYQLENFESGALSLPAVTLTTLHGSSVTPGTSVDADDGSIDGSGAAGKSLSVITQAGTTGATFTFNSVILGTYPKSAGIVVTADVSSPLIFTAYDTLSNVSGTFTIPNVSTSTTTADDFLFWASDPAGISAISVSSNNAAIALHLDHLQFDTINTISVPEPGTLAGGLAVCGMAVSARRRRRLC